MTGFVVCRNSKVVKKSLPVEICITYIHIDRNCNVLPLSLDDLSNHTTLMLKFCKNKPIGVLLLRHVFFRVGKGAFCSKKGVTFHPRAKYFCEKKSFASSIRFVSYTLMFNIRMGKLL